MTSPGSFCLVLHTHLPWLPHHGRWPVGEEWLYQAWAQSYLPLVRMLDRFAAEGRRDVLTLGLTPVLADQLDDPYCLAGFGAWLADWRLRAEELSARRRQPPGSRPGSSSRARRRRWTRPRPGGGRVAHRAGERWPRPA